jgi:phosphatidylserine/phosphatidylglycerophosphate/cardiolipin synthase-like enzyme
MLYVEPEDGIRPVLDFIAKCEKSLSINCYLIDDPNVMTEIRKAVERKVRVRIMVDGKPYGGDGSKGELDTLKGTGASVKIAPQRFEGKETFDHAKYMVSERFAEIGTANLTEAAFQKNREYIYETDHKKVVKSLQTIFNADWNSSEAGSLPRTDLVVSPGSEPVLSSFIRDHGKVFIETEEMGDDKAVLEVLKSKGSRLRIIVPETVSGGDLTNLMELEKHGVNVRYMPANKLYMHAKLIIAGNSFFIGSQNFSTSSLNHNREVGIIIKKRKYLKVVRRTFAKDWKASSKKVEN